MHIYNPADPISLPCVNAVAGVNTSDPDRDQVAFGAGICTILPPCYRVTLRQLLDPSGVLPLIADAWLGEVVLRRVTLSGESESNLTSVGRVEYVAVTRNGAPLASADPGVTLTYGVADPEFPERGWWAFRYEQPGQPFRVIYRPQGSLVAIAGYSLAYDSQHVSYRAVPYEAEYVETIDFATRSYYRLGAEDIAAAGIIEFSPAWP